MKPAEVEQWVVNVVDRLERGERVEDDRVECKRELPEDPAKAARRIAGHANQARSDRILWVIGVDEESSPAVLGKAPGEVDAANWWTRVEARFDDLAPSPSFVNVPTGDDRTVLGLGFDTSRPPYVVKLQSESPSRETPWREGTRVRSANRFDLLRVLVPLVDRPAASVLEGSIRAAERLQTKRPIQALSWTGEVIVYIEPRSPIVFPDHLCSGRLTLTSGLEIDLRVRPEAPRRQMAARTGFLASPPPPTALTAEQGDRQVVVNGPAPVRLILEGTSLRQRGRPKPARLEIRLLTAGPDSSPVTVVPQLISRPARKLRADELAVFDVVDGGLGD